MKLRDFRLYFLLSIICITISSEINNNFGEIPSLREKRSGKDAVVVLKTVYVHSALSENWMTNMVKQRGFNMRGYYAAEIIVPNGESACQSIQSYARSAAKTKEELRQIWHSTLGAFLGDPANKHLTMKLSFGALIGESMNGNFRQPLQREARLEISLLQTQSDKEKEDEKNAEIVVKQKAERRQRRREKKQRQRASDRSSWGWSDLSTASTISTSALSSTSSIRVTKRTKDKSLSPPQSSMATTRELPTGKQYSVRYMGALGRMGALGLIEGSSIVSTDPTIRERGPEVTSNADHTLKEARWPALKGFPRHSHQMQRTALDHRLAFQ